MSDTKPTLRPTEMRPVLVGVGLIALGVFLAWRTSQPARPLETASIPGPATNARNESPQREAIQPLTNGATPTPLDRHPAQVKVLRYGRGEGELGMIRQPGQPPVGPESFAVGKDGRILVADAVNQRVVVYSSDGAWLLSIGLPGIALGDVAADQQGRVYVYDQVRRALHQYEADGTARSTLNLDPNDIDTRGYFHVTGNAVYFADAAARDVLVATVQDGVLVAAAEATERRTDGIHGGSGRIYSMSVDRGEALRLQVQVPAGQTGARALRVPLADIVSARFAGEDQALRFWVQTERLAEGNVILEVLSFSPSGELLSITRMPENDYAIWTAKLVDVRGDGTLVQFLPQRDQAKLTLFTN